MPILTRYATEHSTSHSSITPLTNCNGITQICLHIDFQKARQNRLNSIELRFG